MIALQIRTPPNLNAMIARAVGRKGAAKVQAIFTDLHETVLANSPVHTGQFIRNWVASRTRPIGQNAPAVAVPANQGQTNTLPLGVEPRRPANEAVSRATRDRINFAKWLGDTFYLANGSEDALSIEMGSLPGDGFVQRQPTALTIVSARTIAVKYGRGAR